LGVKLSTREGLRGSVDVGLVHCHLKFYEYLKFKLKEALDMITDVLDESDVLGQSDVLQNQLATVT